MVVGNSRAVGSLVAVGSPCSLRQVAEGRLGSPRAAGTRSSVAVAAAL